MRKYNPSTKRSIIQIGRRIRQARIDSRLSQTSFAKTLGVSHTSISAYERGRFRIPIDLLLKASEVLNKPIGYFFGENADYEKQLYEKFERLVLNERQAKYGEPGVFDVLKREGLSKEEIASLERAIRRFCGKSGIKFDKIW